MPDLSAGDGNANPPSGEETTSPNISSPSQEQSGAHPAVLLTEAAKQLIVKIAVFFGFGIFAFVLGHGYFTLQGISSELEGINERLDKIDNEGAKAAQFELVYSGFDRVASTISKIHWGDSEAKEHALSLREELSDLRERNSDTQRTAAADSVEQWPRLFDSEEQFQLSFSYTHPGAQSLSLPTETKPPYPSVRAPFGGVVRSVETVSYVNAKDSVETFTQIVIEGEEYVAEMWRIIEPTVAPGDTLQANDECGRVIAYAPICFTIKLTRKGRTTPIDITPFVRDQISKIETPQD